MTDETTGAGVAQKGERAVTKIVIARVCECGHWSSEHPMGLGCSNVNDDDEACECQAFAFDFEEVRDARD